MKENQLFLPVYFVYKGKDVYLILKDGILFKVSIKISSPFRKVDFLRSIHSALEESYKDIQKDQFFNIGDFQLIYKKQKDEFVKLNTSRIDRKRFSSGKDSSKNYYQIFLDTIQMKVSENGLTYEELFFSESPEGKIWTNNPKLLKEFVIHFNNLFSTVDSQYLQESYNSEKNEVEKEEQNEELNRERALDLLIQSYSDEDVDNFFTVEISEPYYANWVELKQGWEIYKSRKNSNAGPSIRELILGGIIHLQQIMESKEKPIFKIQLEHFEIIYARAGKSFYKNEEYWSFYLKVLYIFLFFSKRNLKQLEMLQFSEIEGFASTLNLPPKWNKYLNENVILLKKAIFKLKNQ